MRALAASLALAVALVAGAARADEPPPRIESLAMRVEMDDYFAGEREEGSLFMGLGAAATFGGVVAFAQDRDWSRGLAYPLVGVGVVHGAVGAIVWGRTRGQVEGLRVSLLRDPRRFRHLELDRMGRVNRQFRWLAGVEIGLACLGAGLTTYGFAADRGVWKGVGIGLGVESLLTLALDVVAARRALRYTRALEAFQSTWDARASAPPPLVPGSEQQRNPIW